MEVVAADIGGSHAPFALADVESGQVRGMSEAVTFRTVEWFIAKGRFEQMMSAIPVKIITRPQSGLLGAAAAFAEEHAR